MALRLLPVLGLLGVCGDREPPRGVSMAPMPSASLDAGAATVGAKVYVSIVAGQELLRGNVPEHGPGSALCINVRSRAPAAFVAQASIGRARTVRIEAPGRNPDFSVCLTDPIPAGTEVVIKALADVPAETMVEAEMSQELRR